MNWSRVKWFLLAVLILGNLVLTGLYLQRGAESRRARDRLHDTLMSAIAERGALISPEVEARLFDDMYSLYALRDTEQEEKLAMMLMGQVERSDLGGRIHLYEGIDGSITFQDGGWFRARWTTPRQAVGSVWDDATALLQSLGFPVDPPPEMRESSTDTTFTVGQTVNGAPVVDAVVQLQYEDGAAVALSGRWVWGTPLPADGEPPCPAFGSVFLRFIDALTASGQSDLSFDGVKPVWELRVLETGYTCLVPVWLIAAESGEYTVDAESGDIITS